MNAHSGVEVQIYSFSNLSSRWRWVANATPWALYSRERKQLPILLETGWDQGLIWTGTENFSSTVIRFSDRPARSKAL
jgi:hypothetical protein